MKRSFVEEIPSLRKKTKSRKSNLTRSGLKAYFANKKFGQAQPWSTYGAQRVLRGTPVNINKYGATYKAATMEQRQRRKASGYSGRGRYSMAQMQKFAKRNKLGKIAMNAGMQAARAYGVPTQYFGRGGYTSNSLMDGGKPAMSGIIGGENQSVTVTHKEYIRDIYGGQTRALVNHEFQLNPGLMEKMPWLAQIAANYEEYEFKQLVFEFHSTVDPTVNSSNNGSTGTIIMCTNYNPDAPNFANKEVMMQYHGACSGRVTENLTHGVEADPSLNAGSAIRYVRTSKPVSQSLKDFDLGKFQLVTVNLPEAYTNTQIGELWCYYTVELHKPRLFTSVYKNLARDKFFMRIEGATQQNTNIGVSAPMGTYIGSDGAVDTTKLRREYEFVGTDNSTGLRVINMNIDSDGTALNTAQTAIRFRFEDHDNATYELKFRVLGNDLRTNNFRWVSHGNVSLIHDMWSTTYVSSHVDHGMESTNLHEMKGVVVSKFPANEGYEVTVHVMVKALTSGSSTNHNSFDLTVEYQVGGTLDIPGITQTTTELIPYNPYRSAISNSDSGVVVNYMKGISS